MKPQIGTCFAAGALFLAYLPQAVPAQENLFRNPTFEQVDAQGRPVDWSPVDYRTAAVALTGDDGGKMGSRYVILRATADDQRAAWRQHVPWDPEVRGVTVTGWYRTVDVASTQGRGASIRFIFNEEPGRWAPHLDIQTAFYPPAEDWTQVQTTFAVPEGTRDLIIELFHWWTPGETHWDHVAIRPATETELIQNLLPPDRAVDREPTPGRNLPYAPAHGETVTLNPPPFRWLPSGSYMDVTYRLQVSRDAEFTEPLQTDLAELKYCAEMLTTPLEPGTWYWRYGVELPDSPLEHLPVVWSRAREFEVTPEADLWPYPGPEAFTVPNTRPRLLIRAADLPELRRRAAEGDLQGAAASLLGSVARHAAEELVPEPDFLPDDRALRGPAYTLVFRETRPPMDAMERAALAYLLTGDEAAGAEAKRRILHFFSWDPQGSTGYFHNDEPAMWVMMRGVRAYDWTYDVFTEEERALVEQSMRTRAADMYRHLLRRPFENNPFESHAGRTIGFLGEAAIAFFHEWEEAPEYLDYITRIYWGVYPAWARDDGGWNEGPLYWDAYMGFALHFVLALREATGIDLAQRPFFANTPYYRLYLAPPHSQMSPFGDGTEWRPRRPGSLMYWFSTLNRDPVLRWYAEAAGAGPGSSVLGVLLRDDAIGARSPVDLPTARLFPGVGLAVMRTDLVDGANDVGFIMKSSPFGAVSHGHNDQNCFVLEAYGEALAISTGYYNRYGSPHHANWTRTTRAKNGITFDGGEGQDRGWVARGCITAFAHGDDFDLAVGDATEAYGGRLTRALREVVHVRPGIFVIRDDLAGSRPRRFEFQLHAADRMTLRPQDNTVVITRPQASLTTRFLEPATVAISQTDQFDPHPAWPPDRVYENLWHTTAAYPEARAEAEFLTVLLPARAGEEDALPSTRHLVSDSARGVELNFPDGRRTVVGFALPHAQGPIDLEGFRSDARIFAVALAADGTPGGTLLHEGTTLTQNAQELAGK